MGPLPGQPLGGSWLCPVASGLVIIIIISFQHAAKSFPLRSHKPSSLKFKGLYLNNVISLRKETGEVFAVDKFSAMCGSEQMSVGFSGCGGGQGDAPGKGSGRGSSPLPLVPTRARPQGGPVVPRVLGSTGACCAQGYGEHWVPLAGNQWGQGDMKPASQDFSPKDRVPLAAPGPSHRPVPLQEPASFRGLRPAHHCGLT